MGPSGPLTGWWASVWLMQGRCGVRLLCVAALRADHSESQAVMRFLAEAHVHGFGLDWGAVLAPWAPARVGLPTYAFERQRYWLSGSRGAGECASVWVWIGLSTRCWVRWWRSRSLVGWC